MAFGISKKQNNLSSVVFEGISVERVTLTKYLGLILSDKLTNKDHLNSRRLNTYAVPYKLKHYILSSNHFTPKTKIFFYCKTYCRPILYYGLERLSINKVKKLRYKDLNLQL